MIASISPDAVARASKLVDAAVAGVDSAIAAKAPIVFGRRAAADTLRATLDDASRSATLASTALAQIGAPVDTARQAVDALGSSIATALGSPDIFRSVADPTFRAVVSGAHASESRLHAIPLELDPAVSPQSERAELSRILAKDVAHISADEVERIRTFDAVTGEKRLGLPKAAQGLDVTADRITRLRVWNEAQDLAAGPGGTKQAVDARFAQLLDKPCDAYTKEDFHWLAMVGDLPAPAQLKLPRRQGEMQRYQLAAVADTNLADARSYVPGDLPQLRLFNEVRPMFEQPASLTAATAARLAALLKKDPSQLSGTDFDFIDSVHPLSTLGATRPKPGSDWHSE